MAEPLENGSMNKEPRAKAEPVFESEDATQSSALDPYRFMGPGEVEPFENVVAKHNAEVERLKASLRLLNEKYPNKGFEKLLGIAADSEFTFVDEQKKVSDNSLQSAEPKLPASMFGPKFNQLPADEQAVVYKMLDESAGGAIPAKELKQLYFDTMPKLDKDRNGIISPRERIDKEWPELSKQENNLARMISAGVGLGSTWSSAENFAFGVLDAHRLNHVRKVGPVQAFKDVDWSEDSRLQPIELTKASTADKPEDVRLLAKHIDYHYAKIKNSNYDGAGCNKPDLSEPTLDDWLVYVQGQTVDMFGQLPVIERLLDGTSDNLADRIQKLLLDSFDHLEYVKDGTLDKSELKLAMTNQDLTAERRFAARFTHDSFQTIFCNQPVTKARINEIFARYEYRMKDPTISEPYQPSCRGGVGVEFEHIYSDLLRTNRLSSLSYRLESNGQKVYSELDNYFVRTPAPNYYEWDKKMSTAAPIEPRTNESVTQQYRTNYWNALFQAMLPRMLRSR